MTMVPAHHHNPHAARLFYATPAVVPDVMTRLPDACGYAYLNNSNNNTSHTDDEAANNRIIINNNNNNDQRNCFLLASDLGNNINNNNYPTISTTSNIVRGDDEPPSSASNKHHHQGGAGDWLQLGLGDHLPIKTTNTSTQQQQDVATTTTQGGRTGLMLELNLGGGGGGGGIASTTTTTTCSLVRTPPPDYYYYGVVGMYGGTSSTGCGSATATAPNNLISSQFPQLHYPPHHHHNHQMSGCGLFNNHGMMMMMKNGSSSFVGCSASSISPSSSPSAPVMQTGGPFLTRPFASSVDSDIRLTQPPPRRPHTGIWFKLQPCLHQSRESYLPQLSKSFLRIKDGKMTVRLVMKYVANKLGLDSESQVEIRCRGQVLGEFLTLQHVRDQIWSRSEEVTLLPDSSTTDHVMLLHYGSTSTSSSTLA